MDDVAALFADVPQHPSKKRKCQWQRLSKSEKIETVFAAIEGVRAVVNLLAAATKPVASSSAPLARQITECMLYSTEQLERCASVLDLSCNNTAAKKCASSAHRKFEGEERRRQEGEQLLVRGIREVSAHDELVHALEDAKAAFTRLSKKKMPSFETQQPPAVRRRVVAVDSPPVEVVLPPPPEGHRMYSMNQAMNIIANHSSSSHCQIMKEMIKQQMVPVKLTMMYSYVNKYVGEGKPEAPMYWPSGSKGQEIMSLGELKKIMFCSSRPVYQ